MSKALAAPVVMITGATGPLGHAAAERFARDGASLVLVGTDEGRLGALVDRLGLDPGRSLAVVADLRDATAARAASEAAIDRFGRADVLLHLVGGFVSGTGVVDLDPDEVRAMLDAHLWSTLNALAAVVPGMVERGFGRVAAVSSPVAAAPPPKTASYALAKAAEEVLLRTLARETAGTGVTANLLIVRSIANAATGSPGTSPAEMADVLAFLASPAGATVSGQRIAVGGS